MCRLGLIVNLSCRECKARCWKCQRAAHLIKTGVSTGCSAADTTEYWSNGSNTIFSSTCSWYYINRNFNEYLESRAHWCYHRHNTKRCKIWFWSPCCFVRLSKYYFIEFSDAIECTESIQRSKYALHAFKYAGWTVVTAKQMDVAWIKCIALQ